MSAQEKTIGGYGSEQRRRAQQEFAEEMGVLVAMGELFKRLLGDNIEGDLVSSPPTEEFQIAVLWRISGEKRFGKGVTLSVNPLTKTVIIQAMMPLVMPKEAWKVEALREEALVQALGNPEKIPLEDPRWNWVEGSVVAK